VEEDNGITATLIDIGHACTVDLDALQGEREIGGDGLAHDGSFGPPSLSNSCAAASPIPLLPPVIRISCPLAYPLSSLLWIKHVRVGYSCG